MRQLMNGIVVLALSSASLSGNAAKKQTANATSLLAERGIAAFYGRSMEGHKTACGSTYLASELTTAHRTLPCGTKVRSQTRKMAKALKRLSTTAGRRPEKELSTSREVWLSSWISSNKERPQ
jgi:hypothetical protein